MIVKNILITYTIIISFFYLTSSILWGETRKRIKGSLRFQDILIGILLSLLTVILIYFPIMTNNGTNVQIKTLATVIAAIFFGSTTLISLFLCNIIWFCLIIGFNLTFLVDFFSLFSILIIGIWMNKTKWKEKNRIAIIFPFIVILKICGFYLLDKWIYPPIGAIDLQRLIHTICYWMIMFVPALLLSIHIANQTRNTQSKLKKLENMASIDGLTGLYNRRYFDEKLLKTAHDSYRSSREMTLLMIDVDYFKKYNDFYGHPQGDECLRKIAFILQLEVACKSGLCARYGGEEFSILLPKSTLEDASIIANRLCHLIKNLEIEHEQSDKKIVTLSIGLASLKATNSQDYQKLIKKADLALYKSKHNGRDQVSC
ncbi:GGDEF domain-containing protein [Bacillus sp. AFS017336]|uniref:GGDEF domain-containing protein n=1 Tax=Bacillus sp. AFS017336 TaxID=2033489 RepID=UPI000BF1BB04|nr:GGDEF domain-containing protein [Bacillus sp. AFS017336]PEL08352.1 hypothetical protein CN601_17200 [Bacillus sp. AFS017336]